MAGWKGAGTRQVSKGKAPREVSHLQTQSLLLGGWREPLILARHPGTVEQKQGPQQQHGVQHNPGPKDTPLATQVPCYPDRQPGAMSAHPLPSDGAAKPADRASGS